VRILIVKLGSIGDIVHTLPSLAAIRREFTDAEIAWVVEERSSEILKDNPFIDNLIEVDTRRLRRRRDIDKLVHEASRQLRVLRKFGFDIAIDFQGLLKSATIAKLSGAKKRWGFSRDGLREPMSRLLLTNTVQTPSQIHIIQKNLALASGALGLTITNTDLEFSIATSPENITEAKAIIEKTGGEFAILNPGGGWVTKLWHAEKFGQLADRLWDDKGIRSVVTTGPNEDELAEKIAANSRSGKILFATPTIKGFYELAKRARVYVGGDTGPSHVAVAAGTPIVGLFGPTEWWRNGSPNPDDICVERNDIDCRVDCHRRTCSKWICMDSEVNAVFDAVDKRLLS